MFNGTKKPKNLTQYKLYNGVTDFGNVGQFNQYESGYGFLFVIAVPRFIDKLAEENQDYALLRDNYVHILENEFKGIDGLDNITADTLEINDGINTINMISKVNQPSASQVTMRFNEKTGSTLTKFNKLFLTGIKDPKTQVKRYHGLIDKNKISPDYQNEIFTLLYINTDNTAKNVEAAFLLLAAQPTTAELNIYNTEKGDIGNKELSMEFNCIPVQSEEINLRAKKMLDWMNDDKNPNKFIADSDNFIYTGVTKVEPKK